MPPQNWANCGFQGPDGTFVLEADLRAAIAAAAVAERAIWFDAAGGKFQKESHDARFGDLLRYWLAEQSGAINPDKLAALDAAIQAGIPYGNLTDTSLNAAITNYGLAEKKVDDCATAAYEKYDLVDLEKQQVKEAETQLEDADKAVKVAEKRVRDARGHSGSGADAALNREKASLAAAQKVHDEKNRALGAATAALKAAEKALNAAIAKHTQAKAARDRLDPKNERERAGKKILQALREARNVLVQAGGPRNLIESALVQAHRSRADMGPWSAAFVVSCVRRAAIDLKLEAVDRKGVHRGLDGRQVMPKNQATILKASQRHSDYIVEARKGVEGTYQAFKPTNPKVQIGDIICTDRKPFIKEAKLLKDIEPGDLLHGDIVTQIVISSEDGKPFAETIGGNVGDSVRCRRYPLDKEGRLIVSRIDLVAQEDDSGKFEDFKRMPRNPTILPPLSTGRIFALLSLKCKPASITAPAGKSAPAGKQERFVNSLIQSLESPFFDEEILQPQPRDEFESSIERLTAGSPFMGVLDARYSLEATSENPFLQGFAEDFSSLDEPETSGLGEIEEIELLEPFSLEPESEDNEDLATEEPAEHFLFIEEASLNEEREELQEFLVSDEEALYEEEDESIDYPPEMLECSPTADETQSEEFEELESNLEEFYLDEEGAGSEFEAEDFDTPPGTAHDARIVQTKVRTETKPAEVSIIVDRWEKAEAAKVRGVRLKVYECDISESGRSDTATASDIQIAEFTLDLAPNPEFVRNRANTAIPRVVVVNARWANAALEKSYKATKRTDITLWLGKRAFHLWVPRMDIMEEGSAAEIGFVIEDREGHRVERKSIAQGHTASVSLPDYLKEMLGIPGRFDDPKRDAAIDMDGTKFDEFLKGKNRREFIEKWLEEHPALKEAAKEPNADLKSEDIVKAWFVVHDVGVGASLEDKRFRASQDKTKRGYVHGFINRAGYYAATHDLNTDRKGTVYEQLSKKGREIAGGHTINIETVPDIEPFVRDKTDGNHGEASNKDLYASIGYKPTKKDGVKGVRYYKWTKAAFDVLADLYIFASARARHLLTITAHKEMDRNLARSVIWREYSAAQVRAGTGKHWTKVRDNPGDYHGDPYGFDMQALYNLITEKLNALGGKQMPTGARYGIHPRRICKADGEDIVNGSRHLHEFPHQSDPEVKSDKGLKKEGWWKAS